MWDLLSPIEYYVHKDAIDKRPKMSIATRTRITMLPSDFEFAWTNVRDSLHTISGCLKPKGKGGREFLA
jgi:hypothetical protein